MVHLSLMALLKDAVDYLEMNKSFRHEGDYIEAIDYLIKEFPAMKIEEWKIICVNLKAGKYGKMYERLKLPELVEIFQKYEGERAEMMERRIKRDKEEMQEYTPLSEEQKQLWEKFKTGLDLPKNTTDEKGRWDFIPHPNTTE